MRDMGLAFAMVLAVPVLSTGIILAIFLLSSRDEAVGLLDRCDGATPVERLTNSDQGKIVVGKGMVVGFRTDEEGTLLDMGDSHPDQKFSVLIRSRSAGNWTMAPEEQYGRRVVVFAGKLERADGSLQVEARSPGDLAVCS